MSQEHTSFTKYNELNTDNIVLQAGKETKTVDDKGKDVFYRYISLHIRNKANSAPEPFYLLTPIIKCVKMTKDMKMKEEPKQPINAYQTPIGYPMGMGMNMYQQPAPVQQPAKKTEYPEYSCPLVIDQGHVKYAQEHKDFKAALDKLHQAVNAALFPIKNLVYNSNAREGHEFFKNPIYRHRLDANRVQDLDSNPVIWAKLKKSEGDLAEVFKIPGKPGKASVYANHKDLLNVGFEGRFILSVRVFAGASGVSFQTRIEKVVLTAITKNVLDKDVDALADGIGSEDLDLHDNIMGDLEQARLIRESQKEPEVSDTPEEKEKKNNAEFGLNETLNITAPQSVLPPATMQPSVMQTPHSYDPAPNTMQMPPQTYDHNMYSQQGMMYNSNANANFMQGVLNSRKF